MRNKKSQNATEFMLIFFMIMIAFTAVVLLLNQRTTELNREIYYNSLVEVSEILESEINLAIISEEGYIRNFSLPNKILFHDYKITFKNGSSLNSNKSIFNFNYTNTEIFKTSYFFITTGNITGEIKQNNNQICKKDGIIHLNEC